LCCVTWRPDWADDVVRLCYERRHDTPCASHQSTFGAHKRAMERAVQYDIPITLHAGEVSEGDSSIRAAIVDFGARRIGHGYRMSHDMMQTVKDAGVHVEICPTTSAETGGWRYNNGDEIATC
jgi:adenosine deaminase